MRISPIVAFAVMLVLNFAAEAQTKPSDVFFSQSPNPAWGLNEKPAQSIVAKGVTVRGWLQTAGTPSPCSQAVFINDSFNDGVDIG